MYFDVLCVFSGAWQRISLSLFGPGSEGEGVAVDAADVVGTDRVGVGHAPGGLENGSGAGATRAHPCLCPLLRGQPVLVHSVPSSPNPTRVSAYFSNYNPQFFCETATLSWLLLILFISPRFEVVQIVIVIQYL